MFRYLLIVYGMGGAWLWWLFAARGSARSIGGFVLLALTATLALTVRRRSRRLRSPWEWIPSRAITHIGGGESRWHRDRSERPDDPDDFEAHVGGGF